MYWCFLTFDFQQCTTNHLHFFTNTYHMGLWNQLKKLLETMFIVSFQAHLAVLYSCIHISWYAPFCLSQILLYITSPEHIKYNSLLIYCLVFHAGFWSWSSIFKNKHFSTAENIPASNHLDCLDKSSFMDKTVNWGILQLLPNSMYIQVHYCNSINRSLELSNSNLLSFQVLCMHITANLILSSTN